MAAYISNLPMAWVVPAGADARRFFCLDVSDRRKQDTTYFDAIVRQMDNGGREALFHELLARDLSDFNVRKVPITDMLESSRATPAAGLMRWPTSWPTAASFPAR
jgi:hypothetical protein